MSQQRLDTLQVLLERERDRRDEAQAAVRNAARHLEVQQTQATSLTTYRGEYARKWSAQFQRGARMEILRSYHGFLARLDQAITQQQAVVAHAQRGLAAARDRLVEREVRVATVERLMQRHREQMARVLARREQKNLDEMAARRRVLSREFAGLA